MNRYTISIIVLNLIILSNLSYADNNLSANKESKLEQLLSVQEEKPVSLPQSKQIQSSSTSKIPTLEDINKRLKQVEQQNIQEKIAIETFEKKVKAYQKKIESLESTKRTNE